MPHSFNPVIYSLKISNRDDNFVVELDGERNGRLRKDNIIRTFMTWLHNI
ncbi:hypothetical protein LINGRAHAP2_LOCUS12991 [Linum grandiflorum]